MDPHSQAIEEGIDRVAESCGVKVCFVPDTLHVKGVKAQFVCCLVPLIICSSLETGSEACIPHSV